MPDAMTNKSKASIALVTRLPEIGSNPDAEDNQEEIQSSSKKWLELLHPNDFIAHRNLHQMIWAAVPGKCRATVPRFSDGIAAQPYAYDSINIIQEAGG